MMIIVFLLLSTSVFVVPQSDDHFPVYNGDVLDIGHLAIYTLYKGEEKKLISENVDRFQIQELIDKEKNIWWVQTAFHVEKKNY